MIYFDYNATTPLDPDVLGAMMPYFTEHFGNAASSQHKFGWTAEFGVNKARKQTAKMLNCDAKEIIFTGGSTESNNIVLLGLIRQQISLSKKANKPAPHLIVSVSEHKAIIEPAEFLQSEGAEVTFLPVNKMGSVEVDSLKQAIKPNTFLVSIMHGNNEIGCINPIKELCKTTKDAGALFHTDASQTAGKLAIDVKGLSLDYLSLSGHKMHGPKGVGALYVSDKAPLPMSVFFGGQQERGISPGTANVAGIVGIGKACEIYDEVRESEQKKLTEFQNKIFEACKAHGNKLQINGSTSNRLSNNISITFKNLNTDIMTLGFKNIACSSTSACSSGLPVDSHVLKSIGLSSKDISSTLRLSFGRFTTKSDIETLIKEIDQVVEKNIAISVV